MTDARKKDGESHEDFIDSYYNKLINTDTDLITDSNKSFNYDAVSKSLYEDILQKVMNRINSSVLSDMNVTHRKSKTYGRNPETEELISSLKSEINFLREEVKEKNALIKILSSCTVHQNQTLNDISLRDNSLTDSVNQQINDNNSNDSVFNNIESQLSAVRKRQHHMYNEHKDREKKVSQTSESSVSDKENKKILVVGDSMLNGIQEDRIKSKKFDVSLKYISGAKVSDITKKLDDCLAKKPDCVILNEIIDEILSVKHRVEKQLPFSKVIISSPIVRTDNGKADLTIRKFNQHLKQLNIDIIDNSNINQQDLGRKGLHLSKRGKSKLTKNIKTKLNNLF